MTVSKLIAKILTLCGVSLTCTACYAAPNANFELKGNVTDEAGYPVEGIKVSVRRAGSQYSYTSPVKTDPSGGYAIIDPSWDGGAGEFEVVAEDVDGDEGRGLFAADTVTIKIVSSDYKGKNRYPGTITKTADLELELKPQEYDSE